MNKVLRCMFCEWSMFRQSQKRIMMCQFATFLFFLTLALITFPILESVRKSSALSTMVMKKDNHELWGQIPGRTGSVINKEFYINELQNGREVVYYGEKPVVKEVGPFSYQEFQTFDEYQISDNKQYVDFNLWTRYEPNNYGMNAQNNRVEVLNLGGMKVWHQIQNSRFSQVGLQVFSQLVYGLESWLKIQAIAQSIFYQQLITQDPFDKIMQNSGINDQNKRDKIWNDSIYGWKYWTTLQHWIVAQQAGVFSEHAYFLKDYFDLQYSQISKILSSQQFKTYINEAILELDEYYCDETECSDQYLMAKQWTSSAITNSTPGDIPRQESIVFLNNTFIAGGYPEINYFQQNYFKNQISNDTRYDVEFDMKWAMNLLKHSQSGQSYLTDEDMLLNIGNLQYFEQQMERFEQSSDENDLLGIGHRFGLQNDLNKIRVFYEYVKYMVNEFGVKQKQFGGTKGIYGMGRIGSDALYTEMQKMADYLKTDIMATIMIKQSQVLNYTCADLIFQSIEGITKEQSQQFCEQNGQVRQLDKQHFVFLMDLCNHIYDTKFMEFFENNRNVLSSQLQLIQLCDIQNSQMEDSFQQHMQYANDILQSTYKCDYVCSKWELALKQWQNSYVTQNIPKYVEDEYPRTYSVRDWNPELFPKKIEYLAVMDEFKDKFSNKIEYHYYQIENLLSFDVLFNSRVYSSAFLLDSPEIFEQVFMQPNVKQLQFYLRYIVIEVGLGGFTHKKTAHELLWGYEDQAILKTQTMDPQKGGDPSLDPIVMLAGGSLNRDEAKLFRHEMNTGYADRSKTRQYTKIYDHENVVVPFQKFNGKTVVSDYINPWKTIKRVKGTDSLYIPKSSQHIFMPELFRDSSLIPTGRTIKYAGINTIELQIDDKLFRKGEQNSDYYMEKYNGLLNLTSVKQLPLFISLPYLQKVDDLIEHPIILDEHNRDIKFDKDRDTTYIHTESYSGATIKLSMSLQQHYMLQNDRRELLVDCSQNDQLVPLVLSKRVGGWNDIDIVIQLGGLKAGANLKILFLIIFILLSILYLAIFGITLKRMMERNNNDATQSIPLINSVLKQQVDRQPTNMMKIQE